MTPQTLSATSSLSTELQNHNSNCLDISSVVLRYYKYHVSKIDLLFLYVLMPALSSIKIPEA